VREDFGWTAAFEISYNIDDVKREFCRAGETIEEVLYYSLPEQNKMYKNWLNHLYLACGLGRHEEARD